MGQAFYNLVHKQSHGSPAVPFSASEGEAMTNALVLIHHLPTRMGQVRMNRSMPAPHEDMPVRRARRGARASLEHRIALARVPGQACSASGWGMSGRTTRLCDAKCW